MLRSDLIALLQRLFAQTDLSVNEGQLEHFGVLLEMLELWNKRLNLTAVRDPGQMALLHILDSAVVSPLLGDAVDIADVGTGAGFPGLVLAELNPDKNFTLIDSIAKKLSFVAAAAAALNLSNVKIVQARVEQLAVDDGFEVIVSRAFAPLGRMVDWCLPLLHPAGRFIAMKSHLSQEELAAVPDSVQIERIVNLSVPDLHALRQAVILTPAETKQ